MRTTEEKRLPAALALMAALLLLPPLSSSAAAAPPPVEHRFFVGVAAGYFYPLQASFRNVYDQPAWPLELQLGWAPAPRLEVVAACRFLQADGETILLDAQSSGESYALRLRILALRLGVNCRLGSGPVAPFVGAGIHYAAFKEEWRDVPLQAQGNKGGFFVQGGGRLRLARSLHLLAQLEYSYLPAGKGSQNKQVELGGVCLLLGIRAGIF